jgi:hypothetical protein
MMPAGNQSAYSRRLVCVFVLVCGLVFVPSVLSLSLLGRTTKETGTTGVLPFSKSAVLVLPLNPSARMRLFSLQRRDIGRQIVHPLQRQALMVPVE